MKNSFAKESSRIRGTGSSINWNKFEDGGQTATKKNRFHASAEPTARKSVGCIRDLSASATSFFFRFHSSCARSFHNNFSFPFFSFATVIFFLISAFRVSFSRCRTSLSTKDILMYRNVSGMFRFRISNVRTH